MSVAKELASFCAANSTRLTIGTTLFTGMLPVGSTNIRVAIIDGPGGPPTRTYSGGTTGSTNRLDAANLPVYENLSVQVVGRSTMPSSGATVPYSSSVQHALHDALIILGSISNETISSTYGTAQYLRVEPVGGVGALGAEEDGSLMFAFNCDVMRRPTLNPFST